MIRARFKNLLGDLLPACQSVYGDRLVSLAVFGSVARQTQRPDSDIDLLLVVDDLPNGRIPRVEEFESVERLRQRLAELKARRIRKGGGYYWQLKPDFKPGDNIEL